MNEQSEVPVFRRIVWAVLTFLVIFAVLWGIVWVLFLRHSSHVSKPHPTSGSSQTQTRGGSSGSSSTPATGGSSSTSTGGTSTPTQLANTGAGNVLELFAAVTVLAGLAHQIRLRTKLTV